MYPCIVRDEDLLHPAKILCPLLVVPRCDSAFYGPVAASATATAGDTTPAFTATAAAANPAVPDIPAPPRGPFPAASIRHGTHAGGL